MSLDDVPVKASVRPHGKFKIYQGAWLNAGERSSIPGFFGQVGAEGLGGNLHRGQTNSADRNAVTPLELFDDFGGRHDEAASPAFVNDGSYVSDFFDDSGEHDGLLEGSVRHSALGTQCSMLSANSEC